MGYSHMIYGIDLERLRGLFGSNDEAFIAEILKSQAEEFEDNDAFFEDYDDCPNSETALREIIAGKIEHKDSEAIYGYILKIICEHIGEFIGADIYAVSDHPYKSLLVHSGPPIPIPIDECDFPEIGYIAHADIPKEIAMIEAAPRKAKKRLSNWILRKLTKGMVGREMDDDEMGEEMDHYKGILKDAKKKGLSVVSFRH